MESEAEARQRLTEAEQKLERYQAIYGEMSSALPLDIHELAERLKEKDDEIQRLRLADVQRTNAETWLHAELDRLSAAWDSLDRQVKSKVFDLGAMEERLVKTASDVGALELFPTSVLTSPYSEQN
jgi:E3 ubiquitin-protein ligase BRE1